MAEYPVNCRTGTYTGCIQCCGAATFLGGSGSPRSRSRFRFRLRPNWVGSSFRQKGGSWRLRLHTLKFAILSSLKSSLLTRLKKCCSGSRFGQQNNICEEGIYFSASSTTPQNFSVTVKAKDNRYRVLLKSQLAKFNFVSC